MTSAASTPSRWSWTLKSLWFHRRMALALAAGAAAATAVIVGALLVGDSARMSLRGLVIDRLGAIDHAILANRFFRQSSLQGLDPNLQHQVHPAIQFARASAESTTATGKHRAGNLTMLAVDDTFWDVGGQAKATHPHGREVVINQNLADDLMVSVGDEITLRVPTAEAVPGDSPLGKKEGQVERFPALRVIAILPNRGLGRFDWR
ncbi:MAG: ABC transporter permease, partial [Pirellulaceae bacterium]